MFLLYILRVLVIDMESMLYVYEKTLKKDLSIFKRETNDTTLISKNEKILYKVCTYIFCYDKGLRVTVESFTDFEVRDDDFISFKMDALSNSGCSSSIVFRSYIYPISKDTKRMNFIFLIDLYEVRKDSAKILNKSKNKIITLFVYTYYLHSIILACKNNFFVRKNSILEHINKFNYFMSYYEYLKKSLKCFSSYSSNFEAFKETLKIIIMNPFQAINSSVVCYFNNLTEENMYDINDSDPFEDVLDELIDIFPLEKMPFHSSLKFLLDNEVLDDNCNKKIIKDQSKIHLKIVA